MLDTFILKTHAHKTQDVDQGIQGITYLLRLHQNLNWPNSFTQDIQQSRTKTLQYKHTNPTGVLICFQ